MGLQEQAAADLAAIMADTNEPSQVITYTTSAGIAADISAICFASDLVHEYGQEGEYITHRMSCVIQTADVAAPSVLDTVVIGAVEWKIERVDGIGFGKATINLVRDEPRAKQVEMLKKKI